MAYGKPLRSSRRRRPRTMGWRFGAALIARIAWSTASRNWSAARGERRRYQSKAHQSPLAPTGGRGVETLFELLSQLALNGHPTLTSTRIPICLALAAIKFSREPFRDRSGDGGIEAIPQPSH